LVKKKRAVKSHFGQKRESPQSGGGGPNICEFLAGGTKYAHSGEKRDANHKKRVTIRVGRAGSKD